MRPLCPEHSYLRLSPVRTFGGTPLGWHCVVGHVYPADRWPMQPLDRRGRFRRWRKNEQAFSSQLGARWDCSKAPLICERNW